MAKEPAQPPITWRYCGDQIKMWRAAANVTRGQLAEASNYDYETVKSMENGRRRPTRQLLVAADEMCGAGEKLVAALEYLKPEPFPQRSQQYMEYEAEAIALSSYEPLLIPGLLQTRAYAYALISESSPPLDEETVAERVSGRLKRQEALTKKPGVVFSFVVYEAALRTLVGGREVMNAQLDHLLEVGGLRNVSVRVLSFGRCGGVALNGPIALVETAEHDRYAYVEGPETGALYADAANVSALTQTHDMISRHALSVEESAVFIRKAAEEVRSSE
ncbi:helix-turn-helix transcriptional regulator [Streptomyces sp. TS71-3]|uniref:helix-turn-helix domain-containing protein n=1 Tax=Streptomyces sp. TS71-3 TaxID=2733862 RepID=UPI001B04E04F|nr:helix-turn-helix transcriptional regulator [Streptomyces sp. TS71-3]GHJ35043.1 transcriptional regulator [Streptomyces sp. TS71-3]